MAKKSKAVVMIIAQQKFRDEELAVTKQVLESSDVAVTVASSGLDEAVGKLGKVRQKPDITIVDIDLDLYDAVIFIGGPGAEEYFDSKLAHQIARDAVDEGKIAAAICIAPVILARAGLLEGKTATVWPDGIPELQKAGATVSSKPVERDGQIITGKGPEAAEAFGKAILEAIGG